MARKVFFSFHYTRDSWRVGQVRNSNLLTREEKTPFLDKAEWEKIKQNGKTAIKNWIDEQLKGTSITIVLIGTETYDREWVNYEIEQSYNKGNALLGIYIHNVKNQNLQTDFQGKNPFDKWQIEKNGRNILFSEIYKTYDWINNYGRENITKWIEEAIEINKNFRSSN